MILKKLGEEYKLYSHDSCIATTQESPYKKLSKQNCDEIFGVVNVEKLAESHAEECYERNGDPLEESYFENRKYNFKEGFNKAMELNKDKLFTEFDIIKAFEYGWNQRHFDKTDENELREIQKRFIQSLQQPTEIEVDVEMDICGDKVYAVPEERIDGNGCIILKKK